MKIETQGVGNNLDRGHIRDTYTELPAGEERNLTGTIYMVKRNDGSAQIIAIGNRVLVLVGMVWPD